MKTNRAVIVQCRLSSSRLPGKALMKLGEKPIIAWVLEAMHKVNADRYFVATDFDSYEQLKPICDKYNFEIFAGELNDVLKRFCDLVSTLDVKIIIRATGDNPFLFYEAAEESAKDFENRIKNKLPCDYLTWSGLPHGSGVELFNAQKLLEAAKNTDSPYDHEHVGPAFYNHSEKYSCHFSPSPKRFNHPGFRTTIDTYSDYLRAISIVNYLGKRDGPYTSEEILEACNADAVKNPVILVPSVLKGQGTGHLHRCLKIAMENNFFVYIPDTKTMEETDSIISQYVSIGLNENKIINQLPDETYLPVYITDCFELSEKQLHDFSKNKGIIALDEGSDFHINCDYLLDIIPSYKTDRHANYTDSAFITKPQNVRQIPVDINSISEILVCLGGEDPAGFTIPAVSALSLCFPEAKITAVLPSKITEEESLKLGGKDNHNISFVPPISGLREKLYEYDLVITHYGLTAFEAAYAGCGLILLPTTKLHVKLAQKYNFAYIKDEKISHKAILEALSSPWVIPKTQISHDVKNLGEYISKLSLGSKMHCPTCDKNAVIPDKIVSRNKTRTYRRCSNCGIVYMAWTSIEQKQYKKSYFFEEYKNQYGKTYQEDFESIKNQGKRRLSVVSSIFGNLREKNVLDIGCAYGPFLSAAQDLGMNSYGTDISEEAVEYVQKFLGIPALSAKFPHINQDEEFGVSEFDVITMWYVIEHFMNLEEVLRKVNSMLKIGGIFAFSTPSGQGISAKGNLHYFYEISPSDHYTVWEPSNANKILKKFGFEVVKVVSTGHHPERFETIKKSASKPGSLKWKFIEKLSKSQKLGDTCEIYCRKINNSK